jgi:hypothetical protein
MSKSLYCNIFKCGLVLILAVELFSSCKDESDNKPQNNVCQGNIQLFSYPLATGYQWDYKTILSRTDSLGTVVYLDSIYHNIIIDKDTLINSVLCYKLNQTDTLSDGSVQKASHYYANTNDGLQLVATESFCYTIIRQSTITLPPFANLNFSVSSLRTDTLWFPDSTETILKFPTNIGDSWTFWDSGNGVASNRSYIAHTSLNTPAGAFDCIRLKMSLLNNGIPNPDGNFLNDYSCKGLVRQEFTSNQTDTSGSTFLYEAVTTLYSVNF